MRKFLKTFSGIAVIAIVIWAFYNPQLAEAKASQYAPTILAKLSGVSPWVILYFAKNVVKAVISAVVTVIALYIAYRLLVSNGVIPAFLPVLF